jgi:stage II sporulation protein D
MELDTYLVGVLLGEMPAYFETDALRAQAVVARTYAMRHHLLQDKHPGGAVCTDPGCCQAYVSETVYMQQGGAPADVEKIRKAVTDTAGWVLTYEGQLIDATYFSCSGGRTEDAVAVWGSNVAYLQAVDSPGEEMATHHTDTVTFTAEEFADRLDADLYGAPADWFQETTYTDGGGVKTMKICGTAYSGTQLRKLLGLRSTAFSVSVTKSSITIRTSGYGHRVGMSQYGAQAMALRGSTYEQILRHYYSGTEVSYNAS